MRITTVGVVGSRRRNSESDRKAVYQAINSIHWCVACSVKLVSGGCPEGADRFAEEYAKIKRLPLTVHLPDKAQLRKDVPIRAAYAIINYARNGLIAKDADILIACIAPDRKGGTEDTIKKFLRRLGLTEAQAIQKGTLILV